jgi:hypothetical protein
MYRKPRNPNRRRAIHDARRAMSPAMHEAMRACVLASRTGLMVIGVHAINGRPIVTVADPCQPSVTVNWRL